LLNFHYNNYNLSKNILSVKKKSGHSITIINYEFVSQTKEQMYSTFGESIIMSKRDEKLISEIHNLLRKKFSDYLGLYFYGSRKQGNFKDDSDYDIVVTFKNKVDWKKENEVWGEFVLFEMKNDVYTDVKVYQYSEFHKQNTPYREKVIKSGVFYGL
jgi:predicted nucleotidyltransferase